MMPNSNYSVLVSIYGFTLNVHASPGTAFRRIEASSPPTAGTHPMPVMTHVEDLRVLARKRVPRMFYEYVDAGSWTQGTYRANESDFQTIKLRQRVAVNMENRTLRTQMW